MNKAIFNGRMNHNDAEATKHPLQGLYISFNLKINEDYFLRLSKIFCRRFEDIGVGVLSSCAYKATLNSSNCHLKSFKRGSIEDPYDFCTARSFIHG